MTFDTIPTRVTTIAGDCGNGRSGSFSKYLNVEVMAGDYIAVEVAEGCTTEGNATVVCPFLPVAATTDNTSQIWHSVENRTTRVSGLLIGIKADIYPSCCVSGFESLQNVSTPPLEYQAGLFVVTESIACTGTLNYVEGQGATLSDDNGTGGNIVQYHTSGPFNISLDLEVMAGDFIAVEVARDCITDEANNVTTHALLAPPQFLQDSFQQASH
ncbi:hypothetical protein GBAR_LOCUS26559 [Geodia barretti]|uniref:Uncharacterized protein n=1 Tax=Geodia barretti TaxID=519541 RepID=A0AA35TJ97_GEOBA|nr:hypothetical protein GBAR_LOCUS26559 [Geodia barretti]